MTIEELLAREAIRDVMARYVAAADRGHYSELAALFTPDGVIGFGERHKYEGREAIATGMTEAAKRRGAYDDGNFQRHILGQPLIGITDANTASAVTYLLVVSELGVEASGVYIDDFVKQDGSWFIAKRYANMEWGRADSRGGNHFKPGATPRHFLDESVNRVLDRPVA